MKRRYNHETKQWDIVLTETEYLCLYYSRNVPSKPTEGAYLHQPAPRLPYEGWPEPFIKTWCSTNVPIWR